MNYLKILLLLIIFSSVSSASYLLDKNSPICIEDFYIKDARLHYQKSSDLLWKDISEDHVVSYIFSGYVYDADNLICKPDSHLMLGMDVKDFNFLLGLIGVIIGGVFMFFTIQLFMIVGGKR